MMIVRSKGQLMAYVVGKEDALRVANDAMDQLQHARTELQQVREERAEAFANIKAHFDADALAMRKKLAAALAELDQLRITMFNSWERHEGTRLQ
jgi:hypothetical protein